MKNFTDKFKETAFERDRRINSMLKTMMLEVALQCAKNGTLPPRFTRQQIADFVGCSKDHIRRLEEKALSKIRLALADQ